MARRTALPSSRPAAAALASSSLPLILLVLLLHLPYISLASSHVLGAVEVDEKTLPRLSSIADVLVKVDKSYPYGDDHDQFKSFCGRYAEASDRIRDDFLVATVGVESYGDKHNQELAKQLGAPDEEKYPQYFFLKKGTKDVAEATKFSGGDRSADSLAAFVKRVAGIRLGPTGTLEEMDAIATKFVAAAKGDSSNVDALIQEATAQAGKYSDEKDRETAGVYLKVMAKAAQKGTDYFGSESERVGRMLDDGKMSDAKRRLFEDKLRVLGSFTNPATGEEL